MQATAGNAATTKLLQSSPDTAIQRQGPEPEESWESSIKGNLGQGASVYHTLNNFTDKQYSYLLRIRSTGQAMVSLETQYNYKSTGLQQAWTALYAPSGETREVTNGLPPQSSLHLRFFGEKDHRKPDETYFAGTVEVRRKK